MGNGSALVGRGLGHGKGERGDDRAVERDLDRRAPQHREREVVGEDHPGLDVGHAGRRLPHGECPFTPQDLVLGRVEEAIKLLPAEPQNANNPFHFLNTAIALRAAGNGPEAARWQEIGIAALEQGNSDFTRAAEMLRRTTPPRLEETEEFSLPAESKATILALLAQQHSSARGELLPLIAKLNVVPGYPQHLIQQTMAKLK